MASLVSDALAGFSAAFGVEQTRVVDPETAESDHYKYIHDKILPMASNIQKELRGRRFRAVQAKLQEAILLLKSFEIETWPPVELPEEPEWMNVDKSSSTDVTEDETSTVATSTVDDDIESTIGDFTTTPEETSDGLAPMTAEAAAAALPPVSTSEAPATVEISADIDPVVAATPAGDVTDQILDDDPCTRQPMPTAMVALLEAFCLVMSHPSKTTKACEWVLDTTTSLVQQGYVSGRAGGRDDPSGSGAAHVRQTQQQQQQQQKQDAGDENVNGGKVDPPAPSIIHKLLTGICKCSESNVDSVQHKVVRCNKTIMTSPNCGVHEASMLLTIRGTFHIYLVTKSIPCQKAAKSALMAIIQSVFGRMESMEQRKRAQTSQFHTDAFVLFRSLCKLASKKLGDEDETPSTLANFAANYSPVNIFPTFNATDPLALNNKVLSLELLQQVMLCAGNAVCQGERFIHLVQTQLCVTMLKNCMSNHTQVAFMSQRIFLVLVYKFKSHLKKEIEVFMSNIFLRVLDSPNSSLAQKALVLESLRSLCNDPNMLTQIFLNYDCDFEAMNLYKDIVFRLTKLGGKSTASTQPDTTSTAIDTLTDFELSLSSVEVLVTILRAFLKALGLSTKPVSLMGDTGDSTGDEASDKIAIDIAGSRIRSILKLESVETSFEVPKTSIHGGANGDSSSGGLTAEDLAKHTALSSEASSSDLAGQIVDAFDRKRNQEQNFELGSVKFTLSPKAGLNFFIENAFVELDAQSVARFLLMNKDKLDKTQIGEILGREPDAAFIKPKLDAGIPPEKIDAEKGGPGFFFRILYHYTDAMDFEGVSFDESIRLFLAGFRLPGEAQKIDRIMEKFAERFTRQNPEVFSSADTAFILAFSVIMLNTDLHNPSIKPERRMTIESFLSNNRGIGENGADLDKDVLTGIFNRIKERPFSLKEDDAAREKKAKSQLEGAFFSSDTLFGASPEEKKKENFLKERDEMLSATEQLIRRRSARVKFSESGIATSQLTDNVSPSDVVKPMFDVTWGPIIGILSQVLECSNDERSTAVCLNGFVYAIRIAAHSNMSLARDTFVNSLAKFTFLGSIKEMKHKNIAAIKTLLSIAVVDGEHLGESWGAVLQSISQLARMRMSASGLDADESFLQDGENSASSTPKKPKPRQVGDSALFRQPTKAEISKETTDNNGRAILESVNEVLIDKVFSSTVKLSGKSLAIFIAQLVAVSQSEIEGNSNASGSAVTTPKKPTPGSAHGDQGPSIFSLQRLVEVADYNMDVRPRVVWQQIWEIMSDFFAMIGCHKNGMVSVFAVDSLKQLSFKFLEKPELSEFNFQRMFLRPFLQIIENPGTRPDIRELVLQCIDNIIRTRSHNLQSGWKIVFSIITAAANDPIGRINMIGLNIMQRLLDEHLDKLFCPHDPDEVEEIEGEVKEEIVSKDELTAFEQKNRNTNADDFIFMCRTSLSFIPDKAGSPTPISTSIRAICHIAIFADLLAEKRVEPPVSGAQYDDPEASGYTYSGLTEDEELEMIVWLPLFQGLADGIRSPKSSCEGGVGCLLQRGSAIALRSILMKHKDIFSVGQVHAILEHTVMPSIRQAVESDASPVVNITSESPSVSSLDFLVDALPLLPINDEGLEEFETIARRSEGSPKRKFGPAELIVEASFTDMRHGGNGDISRAHLFLNKSAEPDITEDPFPNSWIATTAPIALGLLTDIVSEIAMTRGSQGRELLWPVVSSEMKRWCIGNTDSDGMLQADSWSTCEALVRIACNEIGRLYTRLKAAIGNVSNEESVAWANDIFSLFESCLGSTLKQQRAIQSSLLRSKLRPYERYNSESDNDSVSAGGGPETTNGDIQHAQSNDEMEWLGLVPSLQVRSISAHCLQQSLSSLKLAVLQLLREGLIASVVDMLNNSKSMAEKAVLNEDLNHAFKEHMLVAWGLGGVGEEELVNVARLSTTQGSAMFFLTQAAGASNALVNILTGLHLCKTTMESNDAGGVGWEREEFAAPYLLDIIQDILTKFVESEAKEGHKIDPNEWRHAIEGAGKVAVYCTSFAGVVVDILMAMQTLKQDHIERQKSDLFPLICGLIRVQSEDIRGLVHTILINQFGPLMGISPPDTSDTS